MSRKIAFFCESNEPISTISESIEAVAILRQRSRCLSVKVD